jgi:hypothetical protein
VALEEMRGLLRELGFDGPATATHVRSQEAADEVETIVPTSRPPTMQLSLLLPAPRVVMLVPEERAGVIAALARLLLEAARPTHMLEGADDAS